MIGTREGTTELRDKMNKDLDTLKSGGKVMRKRGLGKKIAISGTLLGTVYGVGNDLRRQRKKAEDAIGDNVAKKLKNLNNDKNK